METDDVIKATRRGGERKLAVSNSLVIDMSLVKQGLDQRPAENDKREILNTVRRIGMLQIDTINIVERSQYLVLFSRLGVYDKRLLDALQFPERRLFEQRSHANCLIPMEFYPFYAPEVGEGRRVRESKLKKLGGDPDGTMADVMDEIRKKGPLSSAEFGSDDKRKRGWWNRKPEKEALEILWKRGSLAVDRRANFRSYYNLPERVIPAHLLKERHSLQEFRKWAAVKGLDAIGIGTAADVADYYRQKPADTGETLERLVGDGTVVKVKVDGWVDEAYALSNDVGLIRRLRNSPLSTSTTTLLSPFDNLIWYRERMERLFGVRFRIEMYVPKAQRTYGYYSMPVLHNKCIIGKIDPKADRKSKTLEIRGVHIEKGTTLDERLGARLFEALKDLSQFCGCTTVRVDDSVTRDIRDLLNTHCRCLSKVAL